jgi:DNA-binding SARP family transcriptional activator
MGAAIERERLVRELLDGPERALVLSAPGGYGKTTVAAQRVGTSGLPFVWFDCHGVDSMESLWALVAGATDEPEPVESERHMLLPPADKAELAADSLATLERLLPGAGVVVLDSLQFGEACDGVAEAVAHLMPLLVDRRLLITTRDHRVNPAPADPIRVAVLDHRHLRLNETETSELASLMGVEIHPRDVEAILAVSRGQVALAATLLSCARHDCVQAVLSGDTEADLSRLLCEQVASQMGEKGFAVLHAAALLREGTVSDLEAAAGGVPSQLVERAESCVPLFQVEYTDGVPSRWRLHDLAEGAFAATASRFPGAGEVYGRCQDVLERDGRFAHWIRCALRAGQVENAVDGLERWSDSLLAAGRHSLIHAVLDRADPATRLGRPALLLIRARLLREEGEIQDALSKALAATDLARRSGDSSMLQEALSTVARLQLDLGRRGDSRAALLELLGIEDEILSPSARALANAYLGLIAAWDGDPEEANIRTSEAVAIAERCGLQGEVRGRVMTASVLIPAGMHGDIEATVPSLAELSAAPGLSASLRLQTLNNYAWSLAETGRNDRSMAVLQAASQDPAYECQTQLMHTLRGTMSEVHGFLGEYARASALRSELLASQRISHHDQAAVAMSASRELRAIGEAERALQYAEEALEAVGGSANSVPVRDCMLELSASLLALDDVSAARRTAQSIRDEAVSFDAKHHAVRADAILAEIDRRDGDLDSAAARLVAHREYILSESANGVLGMYIRGFPHLLGLLAAAIDPDELPTYLLRMVLPRDAARTLAAAKEVMEPEPYARLERRILAQADEAPTEEDAPAGVPLCRVGFFGGLTVAVGARVVEERDFTKRKARLLFAMLALKQGQDVAREQLLEHLWPDMDEERARRNFYVVWSFMKSALEPEADKHTPSAYVESAGGVCRILAASVTTDLEAFDVRAAEVDAAVAGSDTARALEAAQELAALYQGELLPGDLYDDWFAATRDRYRLRFGDAMLAAATLAEAAEPTAALALVRTALARDPWREDLYQAAMRAEIRLERRSHALETFFACKEKLADELGLDPSEETVRLYEEVVAMEEREAAESSG